MDCDDTRCICRTQELLLLFPGVPLNPTAPLPALPLFPRSLMRPSLVNPAPAGTAAAAAAAAAAVAGGGGAAIAVADADRRASG